MPARETMTRGKETGKKIKPVAPPSDVAGPAKETSETTLKVSADGIFHSRSPFTPNPLLRKRKKMGKNEVLQPYHVVGGPDARFHS